MSPLRPVVAYTHMRNLWEMAHPMPFPAQTLFNINDDKKTGMAAMRRDWRTGAAAINLIRQTHPAAVLLMNYRDAGRWRVLRWCKRQQIPVCVWTDANAKRMHTRSGWRRLIKRIYMRWIDRHIDAWLPDGSAGEEYLTHFGVNREKIFYSPTEPDYETIQKVSAIDVEKARSDFNFDPNRRRLVCAGRLVMNKRFDLVIDAFVQIADRRPDWDLIVIGIGGLSDDLKARVPDRLRTRIQFLGFIADPKRFWAIYRNCEALVHLADHEPWGLIINEAAACGLALLCSDVVGAAVELLKDGFNGRIVPPNDLQRAAAAMLDVTDPDQLARYKSNTTAMLNAWRRKADPIDGFRRALTHAGVTLDDKTA